MLAFMASWFTPPVLFCVLNVMIGTILITSNYKSHNKTPPPAADEHYNPPQLLRAPSFLQRVRSFNLSLYRSDDPLQFETHHHHVDPPQQQPEDEHNHPPQLVRAPSFLQRVRSYNLSLYRSEQPDDPLRFETHHHLVDPPQQQQPKDDEDEHNHPPQLVRAPSFLERVRSFNFSLYRSEQPDPSRPETHHHHHHVEESQSHVTRSKSDTTSEAPPHAARMRKSASEKTWAEEETEEEVDRRRPATAKESNTTPLFGEDEEEVDAKADDFISRFKQQLKLQRLDSLLRYREMLNRGSGR